MLVSQFDFTLPETSIALRPAVPRDAARLLIVSPDQPFVDGHIPDLLSYLKPGDVLVLNNTRVLPTQLFGTRGQASVGVTLIKRVDDGTWWGFAKNAKRLALGDAVIFGNGLTATVLEKNSDGQILFAFAGFAPPFEDALIAHGAMPLPPYIAARRPADAQDMQDYQTVFAQVSGSVAAPTASLHLTPGLLEKIMALGVEIIEVTLHVGAGTFLPVKADDTGAHVMHAEWGTVSPEAAVRLNTIKQNGGRIVCSGTTALRLIETAASADGAIHAFTGDTAIFITPGYAFKAVDMLITNFHLPKSTLFMLVSAFCGLARMQSAYRHAIDTGYRFYSYGDASLLSRHNAEQ
jgi:S-adenosylmethionine:tRNA ribosyltransferase-isomerase